MKRDRRKAAWFEGRFGVALDFKAGLQVGTVTTGEIGVLRREIVFTGDVSNQTARTPGPSSRGTDVALRSWRANWCS